MNVNQSALPITYLDENDTKQCQRCKTERAILISRKEHFCKRCFIRFIRGKQRKQMQDDRFRVKYGEVAEKLGVQKVLLALSGGMSSLVLTDVIASLLQEQYEAHKGRQGYELVILNIDEFERNSLNKKAGKMIPKLLYRYSPVNVKYKVLDINSFIMDQEMMQKIVLTKQFSAFEQEIKEGTTYTVEEMLKLCPNKSSVEDFLVVIYEELVLRTAFVEGCQTIVYGHNMTRIANEVIALTVKGRGSNIYRAISDHTVNFRSKEFQIKFPLRDVLAAEIEAYGELSELKEFVLESTKPVSKITKNMTIRDITTLYFHNLDNSGYASTASTVVKTADKLGAPKLSENVVNCQICGVEIPHDPKAWLQRITVSDAHPLETDEERDYAEQYASHFGPENDEHDPQALLNVCYGCIVSLGGVKPDTGFMWPVKTPLDDHREILQEYILTDESDEE